MSLNDSDENTLSETIGEDGITGSNVKLVPVVESIRYRKRAQSAEKEKEKLVEQLAEAKSQLDDMAEELSSIKSEQTMIKQLTSAGVVDMEAALLIARSRLSSSEGQDLNEVIEQLKKEKGYLFGEERGGGITAVKTGGVKEKVQSGRVILGRAAKKAAATGNRTDLHEYLRLRRNFL